MDTPETQDQTVLPEKALLAYLERVLVIDKSI